MIKVSVYVAIEHAAVSPSKDVAFLVYEDCYGDARTLIGRMTRAELTKALNAERRLRATLARYRASGEAA